MVQDKQRPSCHLEWPDGLDSARRSTDCERGRGSDYGQLRIHSNPGHASKRERSMPHVQVKPRPPEPGPLSELSVAIIGFQRDHEVSVPYTCKADPDTKCCWMVGFQLS